MPSGFTSTLVENVLLGAGVLMQGSTPLAASVGGITLETVKEWRNVEFDGKASPVAELDHVVGVVTTISGQWIDFGGDDVIRYENLAQGTTTNDKGAPQLTVAEAAALTIAQAAALTSASIGVPEDANILLEYSRYYPDLRYVCYRNGGTIVQYVFELALCTKYSIVGENKAEGKISATFEARLDTSSSTNTDRSPYTIKTPA